MRFLFLILSWLALSGVATAEPFKLVAFGDSLTAGYGLDPQEAFPVKLEQALRARGYEVEVVNAGVSGDTSTGGLARLEWTLASGADAVLLELGGNDALRGLDPAVTRAALTGILDKLAQRDIPVLLAGMLAPPNYGPDYGAAFNAIYPELADGRDIRLYPFFLDGVAGEPKLNQSDGIHPNAAGVALIVERILPAVEDLLADAGQTPAN